MGQEAVKTSSLLVSSSHYLVLHTQLKPWDCSRPVYQRNKLFMFVKNINFADLVIAVVGHIEV